MAVILGSGHGMGRSMEVIRYDNTKLNIKTQNLIRTITNPYFLLGIFESYFEYLSYAKNDEL